MKRVKKRSGELQEFDPERLVQSMKRAGADEQVAKSIAEKVQVTEGASTLDLRRFVVNELRNVNAEAAAAYAQTLRLHAKARDDLRTGTARAPKTMERIPDVKPGQPAQVKHGEKRMEVRIEPSLDRREVWLNRADLQNLGASEGTRIAVRFLPEASGTPQAPGTPARQSPGGTAIPKGS
jgi:hypothetical protein